MKRPYNIWHAFSESDTRTEDTKRAETMAEAIKQRPTNAIGYWLSGPYTIEPGGHLFTTYGRGISFQIVYIDDRTDLRTVIAEHTNAYLFSNPGIAEVQAEPARSGALYQLPYLHWGALMEHLLLGIMRGRQQGRHDLEDENHELATALFERVGYQTCGHCGEIYHPRRPRSGDGTHCPNECDGEDRNEGE